MTIVAIVVNQIVFKIQQTPLKFKLLTMDIIAKQFQTEQIVVNFQ